MSVTNRVAEKVRNAAGRKMGPDGIIRPVDKEEEIDKWAAATFITPVSSRFLAYLKSITINNLLGPGASDNELRHMEGQRYLVALIERRIENGRSKN